jgi:hypothetical protein
MSESTRSIVTRIARSNTRVSEFPRFFRQKVSECYRLIATTSTRGRPYQGVQI